MVRSSAPPAAIQAVKLIFWGYPDCRSGELPVTHFAGSTRGRNSLWGRSLPARLDAPLENSRKLLDLDTVALLRARCLQQLHQKGERSLWRQSCQSFSPAMAQHHTRVAADYLYQATPMFAKGDF